jgi:hypothetical protein
MFSDILVSTKRKFQRFCQGKRNSNVHWPLKDKLGQLIWQQLQGNIRVLCEYIDI